MAIPKAVKCKFFIQTFCAVPDYASTAFSYILFFEKQYFIIKEKEFLEKYTEVTYVEN